MVLLTIINAVLTPKAIIESQLKVAPGHEYLNPVLGAAAYEALLYNFRFYGNYTHGIDPKTQRREYVKDKSDDPVWNLIKILFPSPAGALSTEVVAPSAFGLFVDDPRVVSVLLNYATDVRDRLVGYLKQLKKQYPTAKKPREKKRFITSETGESIELKAEPVKAKPFFESKFEAHKFEKTQPLTEASVQKILDLIGGNKKTIKGAEVSIVSIQEGVIRDVLKQIVLGITQEKQLGYPSGTVEQALLGFLWAHFDDKVPSLKSTMGLENTLDVMLSELNHTRFRNEKPLSPVEQYVMTAMGFGLTPYRTQQTVNNGNANMYDRAQGKVLEYTFPDCGETTMRHLLTLLLYQRGGGYKETNNPQVNAFFQKLQNVNNGSPEIRTAFNTVVADLNYDGPHGVVYNAGRNIPEEGRPYPIQNEFLSGLMSTMSLFNTLFGLGLEGSIQTLYDYCQAEDHTAEDKKSEVAQLFQDIFTAINGDKKYQVDFDDFSIQQNYDGHAKDFYGTMQLILNPESRNSITIGILFAPGHGEIRKIDDPTLGRTNLRLDSRYLPPYPTYQSLYLLQNENRPDRMPNIYQLFGAELRDNKTKIEYLKIFYEFLKRGIIKEGGYRSLENVLKDISYDDENTLKKLAPIIIEFIALGDPEVNEMIHKIALPNDKSRLTYVNDFYDCLKGGKIPTKSQHTFLERILKDMNYDNTSTRHNLSHAVFNLLEFNNPEINQIIYRTARGITIREIEQMQWINQFENLEYLDVDNTVHKLDLDGLSKLKGISLGSNVNLPELDLRRSPQLEIIHIQGSVNNLIFGEYPKLRSLNLGDKGYHKLLKLDLHRSPELEEISIRGSVRNLILGEHPKLKNLKLWAEVNLPELDLRRCPELEDITIATSVDRLILGEHPKLNNLYLGEEINLSELDLRRLPKLEDITIHGSVDRLIFGEHPKLERLQLGKKVNLSEPELDLRRFPELGEISIGGSVSNLIFGEHPYLYNLVLGERVNLSEPELALNNLSRLWGIEIAAKIGVLKLSNLPKLQVYKVKISPENIGQLIITSPFPEYVLTKLRRQFGDKLTVEGSEEGYVGRF